MPDSARFALHRPELVERLTRGEEKIVRLMAASATATHPAGATIVEGGAEHGLVYRLREGWAGRVRALPDGRSQFIMVFLPGDLFAVKSMFVTLHPDAVVALSDVVLERVEQRKLRDVFDADCDVATRCTWQLLEEERRLHNWVVGLGRGNADERLALLFLDFKARLTLSGTIADGASEYQLPMTQEQIGDHLGISTVHVSRVLKSMRESGIVVLRGRKVSITDLGALTRVARPLLDVFERAAPEFGGRLRGARVA